MMLWTFQPICGEHSMSNRWQWVLSAKQRWAFYQPEACCWSSKSTKCTWHSWSETMANFLVSLIFTFVFMLLFVRGTATRSPEKSREWPKSHHRVSWMPKWPGTPFSKSYIHIERWYTWLIQKHLIEYLMHDYAARHTEIRKVHTK